MARKLISWDTEADAGSRLPSPVKTEITTYFEIPAELTDLDTTVTGEQLDAIKTKSDTITAGAQPTDTATVDAAGAVMNTDTTTAAMSFVIDEDDMATNSATKVPTQQSVKAYVDTFGGGSGGGEVSLAGGYATTFGNGADTTHVITHGLGTDDVVVQLREVATGEVVWCDITVVDDDTVSLEFDEAPATDSLRVLVVSTEVDATAISDAIDADLAARSISFTDDGEGTGHFSVGGVPISGTLEPLVPSWSVVTGKPWVDVKDHGATGDGTTDDTAAIQAAIDASGNVGGTQTYGIVYLPSGDYRIRSTLTLKGNLRIVGSGEGTFLDFSSPTSNPDNLFEWSGSAIDDVVLEKMRLRGPGTDSGDGTSTGVGIKLDGSHIERFKAIDLRIERFRYGMHLNASTRIEAPEIRGCWIDECSYAGIRLLNSHDALIHGNHVDCDRSVEGAVGNGVSGLVGIWCGEFSTGALGHIDLGVHNNHVYSAAYEGINIHAKHASVTGNNVRNCGQTGLMFEPLIMTDPDDDDAAMLSVISGNVVRDSVGQNIVVRHDPVNNVRAAGRIAITGNATSGGNVGIRVGQDTSATYGPTDVSVTGNVCINHATNAIRVIKGRRIVLSGNIADGVACGLSIESTSKVVTVTGGTYRGTGASGDGVRIQDSASHITMSAFAVDSCTRYGVFITGTTDYITINGLDAVDDQGSPMMTNAVFSNATGTNIHVGGSSLVQGVTGSSFSGVQPLSVESGVLAARAASPAVYLSSYYYFAQTGTLGTASLGNQNLRVSMWVVTASVTISKFNAEFTVAGESGSVFRIGVWASDGLGGMPSTLVCDAGTIATDGSPGVVEVTLGSPLTITPGVYWIGGAVQAAASSQPTMRTITPPTFPGGPYTTSTPTAAANALGYLKASVSGAFGAFTSPGTSSSVPRIGFKVA